MPKPLRSAAALIASLAVGPALAQQVGNAETGHELAIKLCTACHIVGNESSGSDLAPPFPVIARDPNTSLVELHSWDEEAFHPTLRHLTLTTGQVADIDAYLDSLRGSADSAAKPAAERTLPPAPPDKIGAPIGTKSD